MSNKKPIIEFSVSNNSVTHLGRNLYSSTPPALAELVANSYDAYATKTSITIENNSNYIIVADNGKGMKLEEIRHKYATIGKKKIPEDINFGLPERKSMGKKGIGKLASFSIGEEYTVFTKTIHDDEWISFSLIYSEMINKDDKYRVETTHYESLPPLLEAYSDYDHGFIVVINQLRRKNTTSTEHFTNLQLSRRFYINSNKDKFDIFLNNKSLNLSTNDYYHYLELVYYFGYSEDEIDSIFNSDDIVKRQYEDNQDILNFISNNKIKGWIGTVSKPQYLKDTKNGKNNNNIIVYMNGKIADEDILKSNASSRIANQYIVGEIQADYFSNDDFDPITSSRQGLDTSFEEVQHFINNIMLIRNFIIEQWDEFRKRNAVNSLPEKIKRHESYKAWLETLNDDEEKLNNKLLSLLTPTLDSEVDIEDKSVESMVSAIAKVINNLGIRETTALLDKTNNDDIISILSLTKVLMEKVEDEENLSHADLIKSRIEVINNLERLTEDPTVLEKELDDLLSKNPWLINPYWNIDHSEPEENIEEFRQKYYKSINKNGEEERSFIDMIVFVAEEPYPVIVEYKKNTATGHANVEFEDIHKQIKKYKSAIIQNSENNLKGYNEDDIKAYYIISEDSGITGTGNKIQLDEKEVQMLEFQNVKIIKYNEILRNARRIYGEHLKVIKNKKIIPDFTNL